MEAEQKKNSLFEFVKILVISLAIVFPIRAYVAQPFIVEGDSMEPNFSDGEYLIVDEISYRFKEPQRGDVIVFHPPTGQRIFFIKRIVGLPGEKVLIENGKIILGGGNERVILDEKYLPEGLKTNPDSSFSLGENEYFVLGDNRDRSSDSRLWGTLKKESITGRAFLRLWPLSNLDILIINE
ncbi:MAG TPA: signal peptidase I [Candidatus Paceibacterota bacterium]